MEAIKNGLRKNLSPAQLWSGARFFLLLNLGLIIYAVALNFYCAPNHFVFGGTTGLSIVLATCFPALSVAPLCGSPMRCWMCWAASFWA